MSRRKTGWSGSVVAMLALGLGWMFATTASAAQPTWTEITPAGRLEGKRDKPARDVSGIACQPAATHNRVCLLVSDDSPFAQFATLSGGRLVAGHTVDLIQELGSRIAGSPRPPGVFGSEPAARPTADARCPDRPPGDDFDEFDGEGVAWAPAASGGTFYVVGSHGCGRGSATRRRSTHLLARVRVDASGRPFGKAELTWRLGEALRRAEPVNSHYGLPLDRVHQGLDIEGIAAVGDDLFLGLRAPSLDGHAFILRLHAADLFASGEAAPPVRVARLALGAGIGIRDLAALPDGRLLVLSGAAQDQPDVPQGLSVVVPDDRPDWTISPLLARIDLPDASAKAEGVAVLAATRDKLTLLMVFEEIVKHRPRQYVLRLPP